MDLDSIIADMDEVEARDNGVSNLRDDNEDPGTVLEKPDGFLSDKKERRVWIGTINRFFGKIGVIAVTLDGTLKIGDTIEIEDKGKIARETVESIQIDGSDVNEAHEGDSVGIKVSVRVDEGSEVYRV